MGNKSLIKREVKATLQGDNISKRDAIKLEVSRLSGRPLGRVSDSLIFGMAIKCLHKEFVENGRLEFLPEEIQAVFL